MHPDSPEGWIRWLLIAVHQGTQDDQTTVFGQNILIMNYSGLLRFQAAAPVDGK